MTITIDPVKKAAIDAALSSVLEPVATPRQIRLALAQLGLRQAVEDYVSTQPIEVRDSWEYSTQFERTHPLILAACAALNKTEAELDALFTLAITL